MRQLSLHVSALNDLEYSAYTEALHDLIADDQPPSDDYENVSVGAREVRAWLRGRYSSMPLADVDAVCSLFAFRKISSLSVSSDPQTLLPHFERPGHFQRRTVFRSHAPCHPCKKWEGYLQDARVYPRCDGGDRRCAAPQPELILYFIQPIRGMTADGHFHNRPHGHNLPLSNSHHLLQLAMTAGVLHI